MKCECIVRVFIKLKMAFCWCDVNRAVPESTTIWVDSAESQFEFIKKIQNTHTHTPQIPTDSNVGGCVGTSQ